MIVMAGNKQELGHLEPFHFGVNGPFGFEITRMSSQHRF